MYLISSKDRGLLRCYSVLSPSRSLYGINYNLYRKIGALLIWVGYDDCVEMDQIRKGIKTDEFLPVPNIGYKVEMDLIRKGTKTR